MVKRMLKLNRQLIRVEDAKDPKRTTTEGA